MNHWRLQASIKKKFGSPWLFFPAEEILASIWSVYSIFFPISTEDAKISLDKWPDNRAQRKYKRNILCRITSPSVMHFMSSISGIHSGCVRASGHLYNRAEGEKERLGAQLYFPKLKHNRFGECWWVNRFYSQSGEWNVKIPAAQPSACSG